MAVSGELGAGRGARARLRAPAGRVCRAGGPPPRRLSGTSVRPAPSSPLPPAGLRQQPYLRPECRIPSGAAALTSRLPWELPPGAQMGGKPGRGPERAVSRLRGRQQVQRRRPAGVRGAGEQAEALSRGRRAGERSRPSPAPSLNPLAGILRVLHSGVQPGPAAALQRSPHLQPRAEQLPAHGCPDFQPWPGPPSL